MAIDAEKKSSSVSRIIFRSRDVDEFTNLFSSLHAPVSAVASLGKPFEMSAEMLSSGGVFVSKTISSDIDLKFNDVFDGYGLTLPSSGNFSTYDIKNDILEAKKGFGLIVDSRTITGVSMKGGSNFERFKINTADLHHQLSDLIDQPIVRRVQFSPLVSLTSSAMEIAKNIMRIMWEGSTGDAFLLKYPAAMASLREALLNLMIHGVPNSYSAQINSRGALPSPKNIKKAIDYMVAHAAGPLRLAEIAFASGSSVRSLQSGFMQFKGMSPMEYLRMIRLCGVKAEIASGPSERKISDIAYSWGFVHLSSFAAFYQKAFGETPSETRRRMSG